MIREATQKLIYKENLSYSEAKQVMAEIMSGKASGIQTAAYLCALAAAGETVEQITGSAQEMMTYAAKVPHGLEDVFEIVGTGGDFAGSFNISTTASIVVAAAGVKVAKHGNRAASSRSGSADCLEALGVNIHLSPDACVRLLGEAGICFMFAQKYHSSMKHVASVRSELGIRTIFNILGPLTNPAAATRRLLGVYGDHLVEPLAHVLSNLGVKKGMVVFGNDNLDEISLSAPTTVCEFGGGNFRSYMLRPENAGLNPCRKSDLAGGTPSENAVITREVLAGARGARRDVVLINAGAGLYIAGKAESIKDGAALAAEIIDSGAARRKLEEFAALSQKYSDEKYT